MEYNNHHEIEQLRRDIQSLTKEIEEIHKKLQEYSAQMELMTWAIQTISTPGVRGLRNLGTVCFIIFTPFRLCVHIIRRILRFFTSIDYRWKWFYWSCFSIVILRGRGISGILDLIRHPKRAIRFLKLAKDDWQPSPTIHPNNDAQKVETPSSIPVNFGERDASPEALLNDVMYAVRIGQNYAKYLSESTQDFTGKTAIEIGPGINYGSILYLACLGARIMVADRFLSPWDRDYHIHFYTLLRDHLQQHYPECDVTPLQKIISQNAYDPEVIRCFATPLEELEGIPDASVDVVFSNAVLEHIYEPLRAFRSLARISKPGSLGFHQVDFRDHRHMEQPLEFLLMDDVTFAQEFEKQHGECGNRCRPFEYQRWFEGVGFHVLRFDANIYTDSEYLNTFIPRLRDAQGSKYRMVDERDLTVISGLYRLKKQ